ncbi:protein-disulfide reductase DsbD domain-containing protein [Paraflavitalea pollutisoli]|uniref:protein-disulfide reductase DsbD domain-containing protein n=1 Tax=Paraflavitalea pollutisoli TaxID=3034143 RepID=UPI0023EDCA9A|nr:protein-disulfide reductase DsbD domain-containing protein [Paraflavitalea sp. H1-2-19X]
MKKQLLSLFAVMIATASLAQDKVNWVQSARKLADGTFEVHLKATIDAGWHLYSQNAGADMPAPTLISYTKNPLLTLNGKTKEAGKLITKHEDVLDGVVNYYEKTVDFVQVVKVKGSGKTNLAGKIEFTLCNDRTCLPPKTYVFSVGIGG